MSRLGAVTLEFADGEYPFRLRMAQLIELDETCGVGPQKMLIEYSEANGRVKWTREIIRLGLIGGGLEPVKASRLVKDYVDERPLMESLLHAQAILGAAIVGMPDDAPPEKFEAPTTEARPTLTDD